jgi:hypothetical protein
VTVLHLLNILSRGAVAGVGVLMFAGLLSPFPADSPVNETFGIIVTLFGAYRMAQYLSASGRDDHDDD